MIANTLRDPVEFRGCLSWDSPGSRLGSLRYKRNTFGMGAADKRSKKEINKNKKERGQETEWMGGMGGGKKGKKERK